MNPGRQFSWVGDNLSWKEVILIPLVVLGLFVGGGVYWKLRDPTLEIERAHLYRVAFSDPRITSFTGPVVRVDFALIPPAQRPLLARKIPRDWERSKESGAIIGRARLFIIGKKDGGIFTLNYTYYPGADSLRVDRIDGLPST